MGKQKQNNRLFYEFSPNENFIHGICHSHNWNVDTIQGNRVTFSISITKFPCSHEAFVRVTTKFPNPHLVMLRYSPEEQKNVAKIQLTNAL